MKSNIGIGSQTAYAQTEARQPIKPFTSTKFDAAEIKVPRSATKNSRKIQDMVGNCPIDH